MIAATKASFGWAACGCVISCGASAPLRVPWPRSPAAYHFGEPPPGGASRSVSKMCQGESLCRRVVARFRRTAPGRMLSFETPLEHLVAQVDPERIEQVLDNLLSNAIKY